VTSLGYEAIDINFGHGPAADNPLAKDPRVRAALETAIDRQALNQVVMDGRFVPDNQPSCRRARSSTKNTQCRDAILQKQKRCSKR
jgi:ABC-type oligopeptide transport system substrate-binding subunit